MAHILMLGIDAIIPIYFDFWDISGVFPLIRNCFIRNNMFTLSP